jgi:hypothetical protein
MMATDVSTSAQALSSSSSRRLEVIRGRPPFPPPPPFWHSVPATVPEGNRQARPPGAALRPADLSPRCGLRVKARSMIAHSRFPSPRPVRPGSGELTGITSAASSRDPIPRTTPDLSAVKSLAGNVETGRPLRARWRRWSSGHPLGGSKASETPRWRFVTKHPGGAAHEVRESHVRRQFGAVE